jgi:hypothetical protein
MAVLRKISHDIPPVTKPVGVNYREPVGTVMHGVYLREYQKTVHKLFINNGYLMQIYRYPKIEAMFRSPMVNDHNLHLCGGWSFPGVVDTECITRVIEGLKPTGYFVTSEKKLFEHWLEACRHSGLPHISSVRDQAFAKYEIGISVAGKFQEVFDLPRLQHDYLEYINITYRGSDHGLCSDVKSLISTISDKNISAYLAQDYSNRATDCATILVGLRLGYPIETTVAVILPPRLRYR